MAFVIIPTDELIFFRGVGQLPTRYDWDFFLGLYNHHRFLDPFLWLINKPIFAWFCYLVGGFKHDFFFHFIYGIWLGIIPHERTHIFQDGRYTTKQLQLFCDVCSPRGWCLAVAAPGRWWQKWPRSCNNEPWNQRDPGGGPYPLVDFWGEFPWENIGKSWTIHGRSIWKMGGYWDWSWSILDLLSQGWFWMGNSLGTNLVWE